jgi:hypothetical protein
MKTTPKKKSWRFVAIAALAASVAISNANAFVLGPTTPGKWGPAAMGTGATVTYSFMPSGIALDTGTSAHLSSFMPVGWEAQIDAAFAAWSAVANITFVKVVDGGEAYNGVVSSADIRIGGEFLGGAGGTLAHGFYPPANGLTAAGDIHFDTADTWDAGLVGPGFSIFQVAAHEIGHAIGLNHTGVVGSLMEPFYTEAFFGPQADDIAGAVFIYGAPVGPGVPDGGSTIALLGVALVAFAAVRRKVA